VNAGSNLVQAFSDEATLAVEFLAIEVLSTWVVQPYDWAGNPMLGRLPGAVAMLSALQASGAFVLLLARGNAAAGTPEPGSIGPQRVCGLLRSPLHGIGEGAHPQPGAEFQLSLRHPRQGG